MSDKLDKIVMTPKIYTIYNYFEKNRNNQMKKKLKDNPFKFYKQISNINIKIAKNISNLNFYLIDIPINPKMNPAWIIYYIKNTEYRNIFSPNVIKWVVKKVIDEKNWIEEEIYHEATNIFNCHSSKYSLLFFNDTETNNNVSETKYYINYIILKQENILRIELVLNNMDLDQDVDLHIYITTALNILTASYSKFKIETESSDNTKHTQTPNNIEIEKNDKTTQITTLNEMELKDQTRENNKDDNRDNNE